MVWAAIRITEYRYAESKITGYFGPTFTKPIALNPAFANNHAVGLRA
jgi:hypothetical protein